MSCFCAAHFSSQLQLSPYLGVMRGARRSAGQLAAQVLATGRRRRWSLGPALAAALALLPAATADSTWQQTATDQAYGGDRSPTGNDVWVSCNPTTGHDPSGGSCVLNRHTAMYTHDPNARDTRFYGAANSHSGGSIHIPEGGGIGTEESPARSCADLAKLPHFSSGEFWLKPSQGVAAFKGYCDLDSFGGGWLMCYTAADEVHIASEVSSEVAFGRDGYRSDCRNYPFNQLMYVEQDARTGVVNEDKALFHFRGRNALMASRSGYKGSLDSSWGAGLGETGVLFESKSWASTRTPKCVQERANSACKYDVLSDNKLQQCPDCYAVRPQHGNATCGTDFSACWCDAFVTSGCSTDSNPKRTMELHTSHEADTNFYAGWVVTITSGTGAGQARKVFSSTGGSCSSSSYRTRASCVGAHATWTSAANTITTESVWETLPCSNSKLDGYRCQAKCSDTYPLDGSTCPNEVLYSTESACQAGCLGFDGASQVRAHGINYLGETGASTTLASPVTDTAALDIQVVDAAGAFIFLGRSIKIGLEVMRVTLVKGNTVRVQRAMNGTVAATHTNGAAVKTMIDFSVDTPASCPYVCSSSYELRAPHECTALDWACGYGEEDGVRRGFVPQQGTCAGVCSCDNAGTASCSAAGACTCRASTNPHGTALTSPWHKSIVRLPAGVSLDGCAGPFSLCVGSNPYAGYRLRIGGETRSIVGYSGYYHVAMLDAPLPSAPTPAPAGSPAWSGATGFSMLFAPECSGVYDNHMEKHACSVPQYYELMVCDGQASGAAVSGGFVMTGYNASTGCRKTCEDVTFCEDYETEWFRAGTGRSDASGVAFKTPGFKAFPIREKLLSVGVRLVDNEQRLS